jgi:hypothetical protein
MPPGPPVPPLRPGGAPFQQRGSMKPITKTVFQARDGREFATEAECKAHERRTAGGALIGLTEAQIAAALDRTDAELADAIEAFAYEIGKRRKAAGQLKRTRKPKGEAPPAPPPPPPAGDADGAAGEQRDAA